MKFNIKHETSAFYYGVIIPWFVFVAASVIFVALGFTIKNKIPTLILVGIIIICAAAEFLFAILSIIEKILGAKIIIESDHIKINMLLRRKKIFFNNIADVKYTHYEYTDSPAERERHSNNLFVRYNAREIKKGVRSKLIIYPDMGKPLILNDIARGYLRKRSLWITNPEIDPDEDVKLYQAYKCYCAASRQYWNNH